MGRGIVWEKQTGFIMIEVIVATVIISIALVAAVGMFIQSTQANASASDYTVAVNLAQKQLEMLKTTQTPADWAGLSLPCDMPWQDTAAMPPRTLNHITYNITTTVVQSVEDSTNLVEVIVQVNWVRGGNHSVQMTAAYPKI